MCEPAYSENNLNFRLVGVLHKLDTVRDCILLQLVLNIYICHLGQLEVKIYSQTDPFSDPRLQRCKCSNNSDRSSEQKDMQVLG